MRPRLLAGTALGWILWTGTEYAVHRCMFHPRRNRAASKASYQATRAAFRLLGSEHRAHHRDPLATSFPLRFLGHVAVAAAGSSLPVLAARREVWAIWAGFTAGYSIYEVTHWRIHHKPHLISETRVEHHRVHHEVATRSNFGVTGPWWDRVFNTESLTSLGVNQLSRRLAPAVVVD